MGVSVSQGYSNRMYAMKEKKSDKKDSIDATVVFGVVGDLRIFPEHDLSTSRHHSQLRNIHFYHGTLCHDAELCVHR